jgi:hypothetical protein
VQPQYLTKAAPRCCAARDNLAQFRSDTACPARPRTLLDARPGQRAGADRIALLGYARAAPDPAPAPHRCPALPDRPVRLPWRRWDMPC